MQVIRMIRMLAKPVAEAMNLRTQKGAEAFTRAHGRKPKLTVVIVGDDPASVIYTTKKGKTALELGFESEILKFKGSASVEEVRSTVQRLNADPAVDGILIQRPLPKSFSEDEVIYWVHPSKDVDAFHPENVGLLNLGRPCLQPCTPTGVMELLKHYKIPVAGKTAAVIGRSSIVGKPMAALLLQADATVFQCHSRTRDMERIAQEAEILVVAAGKRGLVGASMVRPGAVVIDVGIHRTEEGKVVGDVRYEEVVSIASAITPVPGGVGPMTISQLMANTLQAALNRVR